MKPEMKVRMWESGTLMFQKKKWSSESDVCLSDGGKRRCRDSGVFVERNHGECVPCGEWHAVGSWPSHDNSGGPCSPGVAASPPLQALANASRRVRRRMSQRLPMREMQLCQNKETDGLKQNNTKQPPPLKTFSWLNKNSRDTICCLCFGFIIDNKMFPR